VLVAQGLHLPSRLHMLMGVMSYLASPLWLLMLLISAPLLVPHGAPFQAADRMALLQLAAATVILLYGPKLLALGLVLRDPAAVHAHGGRGALLRSVGCEILFATLFAPIVMLAHSWYVLTILLGVATGWGTQARNDHGLKLGFAIRHYWPHTAIGIGVSWPLWRLAPAELFWYAPLLAGLLLAIPLVRLTSSLRLGMIAARRGLFLVPSETLKLPVLERAHRLSSSLIPGECDLRRMVLDDADVRSLHLALLQQSPPPPVLPPEKLAALAQAALRRETGEFSKSDWMALLSDPGSIMAASSA
jgi:membrane glycosyltransferase